MQSLLPEASIDPHQFWHLLGLTRPSSVKQNFLFHPHKANSSPYLESIGVIAPRKVRHSGMPPGEVRSGRGRGVGLKCEL